jgi:hypothetical protein
MVAAGCKFRFECQVRRVGRRGFECCNRVASSFGARGLRGAGLVGAWQGVVGVSCVAGGLVGARAIGGSRGI